MRSRPDFRLRTQPNQLRRHTTNNLHSNLRSWSISQHPLTYDDIMTSSLRVLVRRLPSLTTARAIFPCPKTSTGAAAAFSTARPLCLARTPLRKQCPSISVAVFSRAASDLSSSAQKVPDAHHNKTAADLAKPKLSSTDPTVPILDWDTFFKLRLRRRRIQLAFSVTTTILGLAGGASVLTTGVAEPLVSQIPLDPFVTLAIMTIASGALGWLVGPSIGGQVFYLTSSRVAGQMRHKESAFLTRVKVHRADPSNSSAGNPGM